jgi:hypothetical protein
MNGTDIEAVGEVSALIPESVNACGSLELQEEDSVIFQ